MTEQRNYTITIKADHLEKESTGIAGSNKKSDTEQRKGLLSKEGAKTFAKGMAAYQTVKSFVTQIVNHEVSMVQLRTGSNELQERANFINQTAQKGLGLLESIGAGILVGGPIGAVVGATLGLAHTAIGYSQAQNRINTERTLENVGLGMNYVRAGANGSRK